MNVLKIATAGSVDDGKSTLIGRILYDTKSLTDDKLEAIEAKSKQRGFDYLDFSLATDGLVAEREQGITIDVAHIYFSTPKTSFIIADTPGHIEYTRNMVTGASNSQASIVLIDARNGVVEQTFRHFFINTLLRVKDVVIAVNKMDLVDFSEDKFNEIKKEIQDLASKSGYENQQLTFIPISALKGDNVVKSSTKTPWYKGETLLNHLETLEFEDVSQTSQTRFPVQTVIRPKTEQYHDFRGYAGKIYGGDLAVGDAITVLPSQTTSTIKSIHFFDKEYQKAIQGSSITITLEDNINISRGDMLVKTTQEPTVAKQLNATICWMDKTPLQASSKYIIKHGVNEVQAKITALTSIIKTDFSGKEENPSELVLNAIGEVSLKVNKPLFFDSYSKNKATGSFILIDPKTNNTAGVGFIQ
ncbi:GTP-binding protein [Tenacibaculum finnmarkense genomovar finnmarkense]|uniref:sulfate adenylyltransferase subunit 1 n=1 Tax=Tenacibaculum finnmarkense TaxID=2781243 RepID=UPI001E3BD2C7|nr:GTP-binding protein [Tenacibaculum finnmarkense]MCD8418378.1 GTP-binding protein [Tenacibaculum finnmarkense genomovar finnmarkense]MCG8186754.1 GTP-binding protein [Tenacibaculum finnmarkense genomovar finnmarkense]MCG8203268.1 GTP-binding protein [Tenacibaculum finnmarkense genomovar finnmarkense]MCG8210776.1 GTP-binding protein [Tenacibaculum finnmarkense genomovar finnmarkense]MCG8213530.1 GTP-binding protein [Tenacibaculum finnmarkense genomovar finnmarkense]